MTSMVNLNKEGDNQEQLIIEKFNQLARIAKETIINQYGVSHDNEHSLLYFVEYFLKSTAKKKQIRWGFFPCIDEEKYISLGLNDDTIAQSLTVKKEHKPLVEELMNLLGITIRNDAEHAIFLAKEYREK